MNQCFTSWVPYCSVSAVAERAGVAVGSVYRRFPTKAALIGPLTTGSADEVSGLRTFVLRSLGDSDVGYRVPGAAAG